MLKTNRKFMLLILLFLSQKVFSQNQYTYQTLINDSIILGDMEWGDYDKDGDQDLLIIGVDYANNQRAEIFQRDSLGAFSQVNTPFEALQNGTCNFIDVDNDNDLDVLLSGTAGSSMLTKIYINNNGVYQEKDMGIIGIGFSSTSWADIDHDGDNDLIITGADANYVGVTKVYENRKDTLVELAAGNSLPGFWFGDIDYTDLDHDGNLDFIMIGSDASYTAYAGIFEFENDSFNQQSQNIEPLTQARARFGDLDNDGYEDLVIMGVDQNYDDRLIVYQNDSGTLVFSQSLDSISSGFTENSFRLGDIDNDGDLDIVMGGYDDNYVYQMIIYRNDSMQFNAVQNSGFPSYGGNSTIAFVDFDGDLDLDFVFSGYDDITIDPVPITLFTNTDSNINTQPSAPLNLTSIVDSNGVVLSWANASDLQTSSNGLTYNLGLKHTTTGDWVISPASLNDGTRMVTKAGNVLTQTTKSFDSLAFGNYQWMVQSIDQSFVASVPSMGGFVISDLEAFSLLAPSNNALILIEPSTDSLQFSWNSCANATSYQIALYDTNSGVELFRGNAFDTTFSVDNELVYNAAFFQNNQTTINYKNYQWRVKAYGLYDSLLSTEEFGLNIGLLQSPYDFSLLSPMSQSEYEIDLSSQSLLTFTWEASKGADSYSFEITELIDNNFTNPIWSEQVLVDTTANVVNANLGTELQNNGQQLDETTSYLWRAVSYNQYDTIASNLFEIRFKLIDSSVGIDEYVHFNDINVYPNPFTDQLSFKGFEGVVEVYSINGRLIYHGRSEGNDVENINTINWEEGTYLLKLITDSDTQVFKVVK